MKPGSPLVPGSKPRRTDRLGWLSRPVSADSRYGMLAPVMMLLLGTRNVLRTPFRLFLVVILLGTSLMFVVAMAALNSSARARLGVIESQVGTAIDVTSGIGVQRPVTIAQLHRAEQAPGVARFTERLLAGLSETQPHSTFVTGAKLPPQTFLVYGSSNGNDIYAKGDTLVRRTAGRPFRHAELNANVALMGVALARSNHLHLGSAFALDGVHLRLIGLYTTESSYGDNSIALPMGTAERIPLYDSKSIWVTLYAPTAEAVPSLATALRHRLGPAVSVTTHQGGISGALTALLGLEKSSHSREASSNEWRWHVPWQTTRLSCWPTNPPATLTRAPGCGSSICSSDRPTLAVPWSSSRTMSTWQRWRPRASNWRTAVL